MTEVLGVRSEELTFHVDEPVVTGGRVSLPYRIEGPRSWSFTEEVDIPEIPGRVPRHSLDRRLVRLLALAAAPSYYKALVPARVVVAWALSDSQRDLAAALFRGGLSEFAFRNDVPDALRPTLEAPRAPEDDVPRPGPADLPAAGGSMLVAVGGGKDSIVTLESVRGLGETHLFAVNEYAPIAATAQAAGLPLLTARRTLDRGLFALNDQGALNGHVPVTAVNSVIACLTAAWNGLDVALFSNEASASAGNLSWQGFEVNHQWSKGVEFEELLRAQLAGTGVDYASFLRPLTEIAIMRRFAGLTDYHRVFTSCNRSFHLDPSLRTSWCGRCPKCLFVALVLAPFVTPEQVVAVFGRDPLADPENLPGLLDLLAIGPGYKPFECVGEPEECRAAVTLMRESPRWRDHPLLGAPELDEVRLTSAQVEDLFGFSENHFLGGSLEKAARAVL